jgi:DNA-damage-inducible protein D
MENNHSLIPFMGEKIRKVWHEEQWYFNVQDVIAMLTDSPDPKAYWRMLKPHLLRKSENQSISNCYRLKFEANNGKTCLQDAANTEGIMRIVVDIPSPKLEPFVKWLVSLGNRNVDKIDYTDELTEQQKQKLETQKALTDEWKERGVKENQEYAILTATIAKGTFGVTPSEHKDMKGLDRQNLRDHMTPLELIFTALSEEATKMIAVREDAQGFSENHHAAAEGGRMAGDARANFEKNMNESVLSSQNYLNLNEDDKPLELPKNSDE